MTGTRTNLHKLSLINQQLVQQNQQQTQQIQQLAQQNQQLNQQNDQLVRQNKDLINQINLLKENLGNSFDTQLLKFVKTGELKKVSAAIDMGANIEIKDEKGFTPLFLSLLSNHKELAQFLLDKGADLAALDSQGHTLLQTLSGQNNFAMVQFLLDKLPKIDQEKMFLSAIAATNMPEIKQLIADSLLFQGAKQGNVHLVKTALAQGANKNAQDKHFETALHKACYSQQTEIVNFLLENHCSLSKKDRNGQTPDEVTSNPAIKKLIFDYQQKHATQLQAAYRGFFTRKKDPLKTLNDQYEKEIPELSATKMAELAKEGKFEEVAKLANLIKDKKLHEAMQIIRGKPEQEFQIGMRKVRY